MVNLGKLGNNLGADFDFDFSAEACININKLLKLVKQRLASSGKSKANCNRNLKKCNIRARKSKSNFLLGQK